MFCLVFFWLNIKVQPFCLPNPVLFSLLCPLSVLSTCPFWEGVLGMPLVGCTAAMDTSSTSWGGNYQILEATAIMGECPVLYECKLLSCSLGKRSEINFLPPPGVSLYLYTFEQPWLLFVGSTGFFFHVMTPFDIRLLQKLQTRWWLQRFKPVNQQEELVRELETPVMIQEDCGVFAYSDTEEWMSEELKTWLKWAVKAQ